jgi:hypothetical protein
MAPRAMRYGPESIMTDSAGRMASSSVVRTRPRNSLTCRSAVDGGPAVVLEIGRALDFVEEFL